MYDFGNTDGKTCFSPFRIFPSRMLHGVDSILRIVFSQCRGKRFVDVSAPAGRLPTAAMHRGVASPIFDNGRPRRCRRLRGEWPAKLFRNVTAAIAWLAIRLPAALESPGAGAVVHAHCRMAATCTTRPPPRSGTHVQRSPGPVRTGRAIEWRRELRSAGREGRQQISGVAADRIVDVVKRSNHDRREGAIAVLLFAPILFGACLLSGPGRYERANALLCQEVSEALAATEEALRWIRNLSPR